jgi:hypothetical protein
MGNWLQLIFYFCVYDDMQRQPSTSGCIQVVLQQQRQACPDKATDQARLSISGRLFDPVIVYHPVNHGAKVRR